MEVSCVVSGKRSEKEEICDLCIVVLLFLVIWSALSRRYANNRQESDDACDKLLNISWGYRL